MLDSILPPDSLKDRDIPCRVTRNRELATKHRFLHIHDALAHNTNLEFCHYLANGLHTHLWKAVQGVRARSRQEHALRKHSRLTWCEQPLKNSVRIPVGNAERKHAEQAVESRC